MHLFRVFGILLIVPIVDFAFAAPVLAQVKRQACDDIVDMATYPIIILGKRVGDSEIEGEGIQLIENYTPVMKQKKLSAAAHASSSSAPSEPGLVETDAMHVPASNPEEPPHLLTGVHALLTGSVNPAYFHPDNKLLGAHTDIPTMPTDLGSDHMSVEEPPSPTKGSSTQSNFEMVHKPQSIPVSSWTEPEAGTMDRPPVSSSTEPNAGTIDGPTVSSSTEPDSEMAHKPQSSPVSSWIEPDSEMMHRPAVSSPTESSFETADISSLGQASSTHSNRKSMSTDSAGESSN